MPSKYCKNKTVTWLQYNICATIFSAFKCRKNLKDCIPRLLQISLCQRRTLNCSMWVIFQKRSPEDLTTFAWSQTNIDFPQMHMFEFVCCYFGGFEMVAIVSQLASTKISKSPPANSDVQNPSNHQRRFACNHTHICGYIGAQQYEITYKYNKYAARYNVYTLYVLTFALWQRIPRNDVKVKSRLRTFSMGWGDRSLLAVDYKHVFAFWYFDNIHFYSDAEMDFKFESGADDCCCQTLSDYERNRLLPDAIGLNFEYTLIRYYPKIYDVWKKIMDYEIFFIYYVKCIMELHGAWLIIITSYKVI